MLMDIASGRITPLTDILDRDMQETWAVHGVYPGMAWTPDGKSIVFYANGGIKRIDVASAQVSDIPFHVTGTQPNPPSWGLDRIDQRNLPLNSSYTYPDSAGEGVTAYVIDTGVRITHSDFGGRASNGYDAIDGDMSRLIILHDSERWSGLPVVKEIEGFRIVKAG